MIQPAVLAKFREPLTNWLREALPVLGDEPLRGLRINCSDGRIMLRRPGYRIPPHRDPKWGFITCLMYLAREGDDERWGTQLYTVTDDGEAAGARLPGSPTPGADLRARSRSAEPRAGLPQLGRRPRLISHPCEAGHPRAVRLPVQDGRGAAIDECLGKADARTTRDLGGKITDDYAVGADRATNLPGAPR
jgi:hypothetical protein